MEILTRCGGGAEDLGEDGLKSLGLKPGHQRMQTPAEAGTPTYGSAG